MCRECVAAVAMGVCRVAAVAMGARVLWLLGVACDAMGVCSMGVRGFIKERHLTQI